MPKQNKLRGDWADILPQESTKTNKAKIEPPPWRCRYCKSALVRFGLAGSLRRHVSTIHPLLKKGDIRDFEPPSAKEGFLVSFALKIIIKGIVWGFSARTVSWNVQNLLVKFWCAPSLFPWSLLSFSLYDLGAALDPMTNDFFELYIHKTFVLEVFQAKNHDDHFVSLRRLRRAYKRK